MISGDWIAIAALVVSICVASFGYMREPPLVPYSRIKDLQAELDQLRGRNSFLETQVALLRSEAEWWRNQFRELRDRKDGVGT